MGSKLAEEIFTLNNASSLWWVGWGEKIAASISSVRRIQPERYNAQHDYQVTCTNNYSISLNGSGKETTNSANQFIKNLL